MTGVLTVLEPVVPDRGLIGAAAHVASLVRGVDGPVVLAGHARGGAVITVAGVEPDVVGLVYLAGCALAEGESRADLQSRGAGPAAGVDVELRRCWPVLGVRCPGLRSPSGPRWPCGGAGRRGGWSPPPTAPSTRAWSGSATPGPA